MNCTNCGAKLEPGERFCYVCGSRVPTDEHNRHCHQCGFELSGNMKFCPNCGVTISDAPENDSNKRETANMGEHTTEGSSNRAPVQTYQARAGSTNAQTASPNMKHHVNSIKEKTSVIWNGMDLFYKIVTISSVVIMILLFASIRSGKIIPISFSIFQTACIIAAILIHKGEIKLNIRWIDYIILIVAILTTFLNIWGYSLKKEKKVNANDDIRETIQTPQIDYSGINAESTISPTPEITSVPVIKAEDIIIDYLDAATFEKALNNKEKVNGKTVRFKVGEYKPDSAFGKNCWSGEHLNFISETEPGANVGDIIIGRITAEPYTVLGSWIIPYEVIEIATDVETNPSPKQHTEEPIAKSTIEPSVEPTANIVDKTAEIVVETTVAPIKTSDPSYIYMPMGYKDYIGKDYQEVEKALKTLGFTNIVKEDSVTTNVSNTDGEVYAIKIAYKSFDKGDAFRSGEKAVISYYRMKTPEEMAEEERSKPQETTGVVLPTNDSKLGKDFDSNDGSTVYYINVDGRTNVPKLTRWGKAVVTDGVSAYLDYLEDLGYTVSITNRDSDEPYSGFHTYDTSFKVKGDTISWTMSLNIQDEDYVEYMLYIEMP